MKQEPPFSAPSADSNAAPSADSAKLLRLLEASPAAEARRIKALTALLLIAEEYPERAGELKALSVRTALHPRLKTRGST